MAFIYLGTTPTRKRTEIRGNVRARSMSTVLKVSACPLEISIAVELLQYPPEDSVSTLPPVKPKAVKCTSTPLGRMSKKGTYTVLSLELLFHLHVHR